MFGVLFEWLLNTGFPVSVNFINLGLVVKTCLQQFPAPLQIVGLI